MKYLTISTAHRVALRDGDVDLDSLQTAVGGWLQSVPHTFGDDVAIWCNEEAIGQDLPLNVITNRLIGVGDQSDDELAIHGPVVVCGYDAETKACVGLTTVQAGLITRLCLERGAELSAS